MISHPILHLLHCINISYLLRSKLSINGITLDMWRPIYALINEHSSKYSFLLNLHQTFCKTEANIHNNHIWTVMNRPCAPQNCSHCLANLTKIRSSALKRAIPLLQYLCKPHHFSTNHKKWYASHSQRGEAYVQHTSKQDKYTY